MNSWTFVIKDLKICSINNAYATRDRRKTIATVKWIWSLKVQMLSHSEEISRIKAKFNHLVHFLSIDYYWFLPPSELLTKKGTVNLRAGDWSNFPKIPDDCIFNDVLGLEDGLVCKGTVYKLPSKVNYHVLKIVIKLHDISKLHVKSDVEFPSSLLSVSEGDLLSPGHLA